MSDDDKWAYIDDPASNFDNDANAEKLREWYDSGKFAETVERIRAQGGTVECFSLTPDEVKKVLAILGIAEDS